MQSGPLHESLKPLSFLIGKWKSTSAKGFYPTIKPFTYCEEISFSSVGQPILNYAATSWHPEKKNPLHLESGFLRIKPDTNELSFLLAHNFGVTTLEEGCVKDNEVSLKSVKISRMFFAKDPAVTETERCYKFNRDTCHLEYTFSMATSATPLMEHLKVVYEKCAD